MLGFEPLNTSGLNAPFIIVIITPRGGSNIVGHKIWISKKVYEPYIRWLESEGREQPENIKIEIDGLIHDLEIGRAPSGKKALEALPKKELAQKIKAVQKELSVTRAKATQVLITRAKKEIGAAKSFQAMIVDDDEEFILLLIMSEM